MRAAWAFSTPHPSSMAYGRKGHQFGFNLSPSNTSLCKNKCPQMLGKFGVIPPLYLFFSCIKTFPEYHMLLKMYFLVCETSQRFPQEVFEGVMSTQVPGVGALIERILSRSQNSLQEPPPGDPGEKLVLTPGCYVWETTYHKNSVLSFLMAPPLG